MPKKYPPEFMRDVVMDGVNLQVVNGSGDTGTVNGAGNIIVGYNLGDTSNQETGSHNMVIGDFHTYTRAVGIVSGTATA